MPIDSTKFAPIGTLYFFAAPFVNPSGLSQIHPDLIEAGLLRVRVTPTRPNPNWYHGGIVSQFDPDGRVVARAEVPLTGLIWAVSPIVRPYQVGIYRTKGMRGQTVSYAIDGYTGPDSDWQQPGIPPPPQTGHLAGLNLSLNYGP